MAVSDTNILDALKSVIDPNLNKDFVTAKSVKNLRIESNAEGGAVSLDIELGYPAKKPH